MVEKEIRFKGIVDVGVLVLSHCKNPALNSALIFLNKILKLEIPCLIPTSAFIGAYHILTNFLKVAPIEAKNSLANTLQFKKPIFLENLALNNTQRALELAAKYRIESWDGYIISLMEELNLSTIYTLDTFDFSKLEWISAINPIDKMEFSAYQKWLKKLRDKL